MPDRRPGISPTESRGRLTEVCEACSFGKTVAASDLVCHIRGHAVRRCIRCGLVYVNPLPTDQELADFYRTYHHQSDQLQLSQTGEVNLFHQILDQVQEIRRTGALLDVGSSYGYFLHQARQRGFITKGVEVASEPAQYSRSQLNLDVVTGRLEDANFMDGQFDVVTLLNVLEHVTDPFSLLSEIRRIMARRGLLIVVVPNLNFGYPFLWFPSLFSNYLNKGINISVFDVPAHLFLFTPGTLSLMLRAAGFSNIKITNAPVIENPGRLKTLAKNLTQAVSGLLHVASGGRWVVGYSMLVTAET